MFLEEEETPGTGLVIPLAFHAAIIHSWDQSKELGEQVFPFEYLLVTLHFSSLLHLEDHSVLKRKGALETPSPILYPLLKKAWPRMVQDEALLALPRIWTESSDSLTPDTPPDRMGNCVIWLDIGQT